MTYYKSQHSQIYFMFGETLIVCSPKGVVSKSSYPISLFKVNIEDNVFKQTKLNKIQINKIENNLIKLL